MPHRRHAGGIGTIGGMDIRLNGKPYDAADGSTLTDLVTQLGLSNARLAIEVNGEIVTRSAHPTYAVQPGDTVEIVHAIGGG